MSCYGREEIYCYDHKTVWKPGPSDCREMSEILGIEYYDRDIVEETSKKMNLPVSKISEHEETYSTNLFSMLLPLGSDSIAKQDEIYNV